MAVVVRTDREIKMLRVAGRIVGRILKELTRRAVAGVSTGELAEISDAIIGEVKAVALFKGVKQEDCIVVTSNLASLKKIDAFKCRGVQVWMAPLVQGQIDLKWTFKELAKNDILSILIEGGAHIIGSALRNNLVDAVNNIEYVN